jgi:hypothetical protein
MVPEGARTSILRKRIPAHALAEAKVNRRMLWPAEVRERGSKVFWIVTQLIHDNSRIPVEIRSRKGGSFYAMAKGRVAKGSNRSEALLRLVEVLGWRDSSEPSSTR